MLSRKWHWLIYLQERNGDADIESGFVDTVGERESGMNRKSNIDIYIYTLSCVK